MNADQLVTAAREYLDAVMSRAVPTLPPTAPAAKSPSCGVTYAESSTPWRTSCRLSSTRRNLGDAVGGLYFAPDDVATLLRALLCAAECLENHHADESSLDQAARIRQLTDPQAARRERPADPDPGRARTVRRCLALRPASPARPPAPSSRADDAGPAHLDCGRRGHATLAELWWRWGRFAAFRKSALSRPSLPHGSGPATPPSTRSWPGGPSCDTGSISRWRSTCWWSRRPRRGKTGWLARVILRYPGPVLSTTTKHDVYERTSGIRQRRGPVHVFNPQSIGGVASTFRWSPLQGCENPSTAIRRADSITQAVSLGGHRGRDLLDRQGQLMDAGDVPRRRRSQVPTCAPSSGGPWATRPEAEEILAGNDAHQWAAELAEMRSEAQKTAATVRMVLSRALAFMTDPQLAASVLPAACDAFSIPDFLAESGTLYMIADSAAAEAPLAPLFACMANEIHWERSARPGLARRPLYPPLGMALDEVTQICPVPLPVWLADSGGKGVQIIAVAHGDAQLASRWKGRRPAHHPGHQRREAAAARHHRHRNPGDRQQTLRRGRRTVSTGRSTSAATQDDTGHDPVAAGRPCAGDPGQHARQSSRPCRWSGATALTARPSGAGRPSPSCPPFPLSLTWRRWWPPSKPRATGTGTSPTCSLARGSRSHERQARKRHDTG